MTLTSVQSLAAIFATQVKIDRMKNIDNQKEQTGNEKSDFNNCFSWFLQQQCDKWKIIK